MRGSASPLRAAAFCAVALTLTGVIGLLLPVGYHVDAITLHGFRQLDRPRAAPLFVLLSQVGNPVVYGVVGALIATVALARSRPRVALAVVAILIASGATTELLKPLLGGTRPPEWAGADWTIGQGSWPSGHATAAMSLSMCAILVAPARLRQLTATAGVLLTIAVSYMLVITAAHLLSDVIGAFFVSSLWTTLALAALRHGRPARVLAASARPQMANPVLPFAAVVSLGTLVGLAGMIARPEAVAAFLPGHAALMAAVVLIALTVPALAGWLAHMTSLGERPMFARSHAP